MLKPPSATQKYRYTQIEYAHTGASFLMEWENSPHMHRSSVITTCTSWGFSDLQVHQWPQTASRRVSSMPGIDFVRSTPLCSKHGELFDRDDIIIIVSWSTLDGFNVFPNQYSPVNLQEKPLRGYSKNLIQKRKQNTHANTYIPHTKNIENTHPR